MGVSHGIVTHFEDRGLGSNPNPVSARLHDPGSATLTLSLHFVT